MVTEMRIGQYILVQVSARVMLMEQFMWKCICYTSNSFLPSSIR